MSRPTICVESHLRSVAKGASYRLVGSVSTILISYLMTGSSRLATLIGASEIAAKIVLFWGHERIWHRIRWGCSRVTEQPVEKSVAQPATPAAERGFALGASSPAHHA